VSNRLRRPGRLTSLPPVIIDPPERSGGGGPRRVPRRSGFLSALVWTLLALLLGMVSCAPARAAPPPEALHGPAVVLPYPAPLPTSDGPPSWSVTHWSNGVTTYTYIWIGQGRYIECLTDNHRGHTDCNQ
jgi:hypothetical protein